MDKLQFCINICKENSESLLKRVTNETDLKSESSEGKDLWFDLLKKLYEFEDILEKKQIKDEAKGQAEAEAAKAAKKAANSMQESIDDAWSDYGKKVNQEDHIKSLRENLHKADANAKYYEDLYKKGQITKSELEKQLASSKSTISGLNTRVDNLQGSLDKAFKGQDRLSKDLRKSESGRKMVEKSLRNWKIGTGIGAGITAAGIGAYALRNRKKNRD